MMKKSNPLLDLPSDHRVALVTHEFPDGDAYGSLLGLQHILRPIVKRVDGFISCETTSKFSFLPGFSKLQSDLPESQAFYDMCIVLDCGNVNRTGKFRGLVEESNKIINIDHHVSNARFGHKQWIDVEASSTSEIVTHLARHAGIVFNPEAATCLLTGIMMDTGSFLYENTAAETHRQAAFLIDRGADHDVIRDRLFQSRPLQNVRFLAHMIDTMELLESNQAILITVTNALLQAYGVAYEDLDEYIAYARDIQNIELAVMIKEQAQDEVKISFRSKSWLNVNALAAQLDGGGHERAAGAVFSGTIAEARSRILPLISVFLSGGTS